MKFKKVQPNRKSIMADPRVKELWKEDQWWCYLAPGWMERWQETASISAANLRDLADILNTGLEECWPDEGPHGRVPLTQPNPAIQE
jgi:hypothetical protein